MGPSKIDILTEHLTHRKRLDGVTSRIDNISPIKRSHIVKDLKGKIIHLTKQDEINSRNKILVDKLIKVTSRESSIQRKYKNYSQKRQKKPEDSQIPIENLRLFNKIISSKSNYSYESLKKQYKYSEALRQMIQKHSGRLTKYANYSSIESQCTAKDKANKSLKNLHNADY